jgi:hypothetical protein
MRSPQASAIRISLVALSDRVYGPVDLNLMSWRSEQWKTKDAGSRDREKAEQSTFWTTPGVWCGIRADGTDPS